VGTPPAALRPVVFDTGVVVSSLLFRSGPASALRTVWQSRTIESLVSRATLDELVRVLHYPKFALSPSEIELLLADFLPFSRLVVPDPPRGTRLPRCRDRDDQKFLELAGTVAGSSLVTGDRDLLDLHDRAPFEIVTVAQFLASHSERTERG
jgi:putative PIN family toxin of toxin-antitoxin system